MLTRVKHLLNTKTVKIIGLVFLLALLASSVYFYRKQNTQLTQYEADQFQKDITTLQENKKYDEAEDKLNSYINDKNMSSDVKAQLIYALGTTFVQNKQYDKAVDAFKKSAEVKGSLTFTTAHSIADAAASSGDKTTAIEYYKKTIEIAKTDDDPYDDQSIEAYERTIKYLQSGTSSSEKQYNQIPKGVNVPKEFLQ